MGERYDDQDVERLRRAATTVDALLVAVGVLMLLTGATSAGLGIAAVGACAAALVWAIGR